MSVDAFRKGSQIFFWAVVLFVSGAFLFDRLQAQPPDGKAKLFQLFGDHDEAPVGAGFLLQTETDKPQRTLAVWLHEGASVAWVDLPGPDAGGSHPVQIVESSTNLMNEGELFLVHYRSVTLDLMGEIDAGRAQLYEGLPIYRSILAPLLKPCFDTSEQGRAATAAPSGTNETADEKARRLCPDGNCTEYVRDYVERLIRDLRAQGLRQAPDLLQELLDGKRFKIDFDRKYVTRGQCDVVYYNPFIGEKCLLIAPECLCEDKADFKIAYLAAALALWAKDREMDVETAAFILTSIILKQEGGLKELVKLLEIFGKLMRALEGPYPLISCLMQVLVDGAEYKGDQSTETKRKVKEQREKLERLAKQLKNLSKEEVDELVRQLNERLELIIKLIKARQWDLLQLIFGIQRGCIDPQALKFIDSWELPPSNSSGQGTVQDVNGDRLADRISTDEENQAVLIWPGHGDGSFGEPVPYAVEGGPHQVTVGQFDEQSGLDLVIATRSRGAVLLLNPTGPAPTQVALPSPANVSIVRVADLNGDGLDDVIAVDALSPLAAAFVRTDSGFVLGPEISTVAPVFDLALGDWSGDGRPDLVVADGSTIDLYLNSGGIGAAWSGWTAAGSLPFPGADALPTKGRLLLQDVDGDLALDILALNSDLGHAQSFLQHPPDGNLQLFRAGRLLELPGPTDALAADDVDDDGYPDLLVATRGAELLVFRGPLWRDPSLRLTAPSTYSLSGPARDLHLIDLDNDGERDALVLQDNGGRVFLSYFRQHVFDCALTLAIHPADPLATSVVLALPGVGPGQELGVLQADRLAGPWRRLLAEHVSAQEGNVLVVPASNAGRYFRLVEKFCSLEISGPADLIVDEAAVATLNVVIELNTGGQPTFQWQRAGADPGEPFQDIPGATGDSYQTEPVRLSESGSRFRCLVDNECTSMVSRVAVMHVTVSNAR